MVRAASFLLLADSRASFAIEGERPPHSRFDHWGRAVMQAGKHPLTLDELLRLHAILIEDTRFIHAGHRPDVVFLEKKGSYRRPAAGVYWSTAGGSARPYAETD